jgi:hypothetical protein
MNIVAIIISSMAGALSIGFVCMELFWKAYAGEKGKNRAAKEDIAEITKNQEEVLQGFRKKEYISKARFDIEMQIYRELSQDFFPVMLTISTLVPPGLVTRPANKEIAEEQEKKDYEAAHNAIIKAQETLFKNAAFIPKEFYESYYEILKLARTQTFVFEQRWNALNANEDKDKPKMEDYKRSGELQDKVMGLNDKIRDHLSNLEINS